MIKYSHVRLLILCNSDDVEKINSHLGVDPTEVKSDDGKNFTHTWCLDSPMNADGDPTARLAALAEAIEPFADKVVSLDSKFPRFIDIVYHVTPQHVGGITGEFDWFRCPAQLMGKISGWNLDVSYETFWFDHPEWERLKLPCWRQFLATISRVTK